MQYIYKLKQQIKYMKFEIISGTVFIENLNSFLKILNEISIKHNVKIQGMDANKIAGEMHIQFAIDKACLSMKMGKNIAKDMGIEIMRYASGKRQIMDAFSIGLYEGKNDVIFIIFGNEINKITNTIDEIKTIIYEKPLLDYTYSKKNKIMEQFNITDCEIKAVGIEKIALLVIERVALADL